MILPEIAERLYEQGYAVLIDDSHEFITVSLKNRKISFSEIEAACDNEIDRDIRMGRTSDGKSVIIRG